MERLPRVAERSARGLSREQRIRELVATLLRAWGMPEADTAVTARHLLYADLHGIESHGCAMLFDYHRELRAGRLVMGAKVEVGSEGPTTALLDGGGGLGHVPADRATRLAIAMAQRSGVGVVTVRNSGHFGAAGAYAGMAAAEGLIGVAATEGLIGVATTSTRTPSVVPTFGVDAVLGTNPISLAAPAGVGATLIVDRTLAVPYLDRAATRQVPARACGRARPARASSSRSPPGPAARAGHRHAG
jgi:LDH2 family malate/lactate/ureidoglycolate dehydrogenase